MNKEKMENSVTTGKEQGMEGTAGGVGEERSFYPVPIGGG